MRYKDIVPRKTTLEERIALRKEFNALKKTRQFQVDIKKKFKSSEQRKRCFYCGLKLVWSDRSSWHIDHKIPIYRGGPNDICNFAIACRECNLYKGADKLVREKWWRPGYTRPHSGTKQKPGKLYG